MISPARPQPAFPDLSLSEFFDKVYRPRRLPGGNPNSVRLHQMTIRRFGRYLNRPAMISDLNEDAICAFLDACAGQRSPRTSNSHLNRLMALARRAALKGRLAEIPDIFPRPEPRHLPVAYTLDQMGRLLQACAETPGMIDGIPAARYWLTVALVLYDTGIRAGACWAIRRVGDVNLTDRTVFIPAEHQKQRQDQLLRISRETTQAIAAIWEPDRTLLFPWPNAPCTRYLHWRRILRRAGLPQGRVDMFHKLRKTCATLAKRFGADPTFQLGHSGDAVTRRYYLAPDNEIHAADVLPRPWSNVPEIEGPRPAGDPKRLVGPRETDGAVPTVIDAEVIGPVDRPPIDDRRPPERPADVRELIARADDLPLPDRQRPEDSIRQVIPLLLRGLSMKAISIRLGKTPTYVKCLRGAHPGLWAKVAAEIGAKEELAAIEANFRPENSARTPEEADRLVRDVMPLLFQGLSMRAASLRKGRHAGFVQALKSRHPGLWVAIAKELGPAATPKRIGPAAIPPRLVAWPPRGDSAPRPAMMQRKSAERRQMAPRAAIRQVVAAMLRDRLAMQDASLHLGHARNFACRLRKAYPDFWAEVVAELAADPGDAQALTLPTAREDREIIRKGLALIAQGLSMRLASRWLGCGPDRLRRLRTRRPDLWAEIAAEVAKGLPAGKGTPRAPAEGSAIA